MWAPGFDRVVEEPVPEQIEVPAGADLVVTEGNYLLLDEPRWREVRAQLDAVWHLVTDESLRLERLVARHVEFGKSRSRGGGVGGAGRRAERPAGRGGRRTRRRRGRPHRLGRGALTNVLAVGQLSTRGYAQRMLILGIILFGMVVGAGAQLILGRTHGKVDWTMAIVAGLVGSFVGGLVDQPPVR